MSTAPIIHDQFDEERPPKLLPDRTFGLVFSWVFMIIGWSPFALGGSVRGWALLLGGVLLIIALTAPRLLHSLNVLWTKLATLSGSISTFMTTAVIFYTVFFPAAFILRVLAKDLLSLRRNADASTYWNAHQRTHTGPESMHDQF